MKTLDARKIHWLKNHRPATHAEYLEISAHSNAFPPKFPRLVYLEVGWDCNLDCTFCSKPTRREPGALLDLEDYYRVVDECGERGTYYLNLHMFNEPLLYMDLVLPIIRRAKEKLINKVSLTTNVTPLTEDRMIALVEAGLDVLHMSFEGANPEIYKEVRGASFKKIAGKIEMARRVRDRHGIVDANGLKPPWLGITLMQTRESEEELEAFTRKWSQVVDRVEIRPVLEFLGRIQDSRYAVKPPERIPCRYIGDRLAVLADGTITGCSVDLDGQLALENVRDTTLEEVWTSSGYGDLYRKHIFQMWDQLPEPCKSCGSWDFTAVERSKTYVAGEESSDHGS